jgi:hypothetical protein
MDEVGFGLTGMACNGRSQLLASLEWLGTEEVRFGQTGMALNRGSRFWPDWKGLDWRKSVFA